MWLIGALVVVYMVTLGHTGPLGPDQDGFQKTNPQDMKVVGIQDDSFSHTSHPNPSQAKGNSDINKASRMLTKSAKPPINSMPLSTRNNYLERCNHPSMLPRPENCQYFSLCEPIELPDVHYGVQVPYTCWPGYHFDESMQDCRQGECLTVDVGLPLRDHEMEPTSPPAPPSPQIPSWYDEVPFWFKIPPPWYQISPAWLKDPTKQQGWNDQIQIGGTDLDIEKPDQIIKNVGYPNGSSGYDDNKALRINIPIKIVQQ